MSPAKNRPKCDFGHFWGKKIVKNAQILHSTGRKKLTVWGVPGTWDWTGPPWQMGEGVRTPYRLLIANTEEDSVATKRWSK